MKKVNVLGAFLLSLLLLAPLQASRAAVLAGEFNWIHDPSRLIKCNGKYYVYYTGDKVLSRASTDLINWKTGKSVLDRVPDWARQAVPGAKSEIVWAPDVIFLNNKYYLFWSFSTFGSKVSVIGLATSPTLDPESPAYKWSDQGLVIASNNGTIFNAIDPAPIIDAAGDLWLSFGSWNKGGIQVVKLDKNIGKPIGGPITIAAGQATGPEAPYLHFHDGYYYLFENEGTCCAGLNSTYRIMMGRSKTISGPFLDKTGRDLSKGGGTVFLSTNAETMGPGHMGILREDGIDRFSFHFYDGRANGVPTMGLQTLLWDADGWPRSGSDLPGGHYAIVSRASGLTLGVQEAAFAEGTPIDQFDYKGGVMQQWNISPTGDGYYSIASLGTGKFMDLLNCSPQDGTKISQYPWFNNDCQKWRIEQVGDDLYRIVAKSGSAITLPGGVKTPQALVQGYAWKGDAGQQWIFKKP